MTSMTILLSFSTQQHRVLTQQHAYDEYTERASDAESYPNGLCAHFTTTVWDALFFRERRVVRTSKIYVHEYEHRHRDVHTQSTTHREPKELPTERSQCYRCTNWNYRKFASLKETHARIRWCLGCVCVCIRFWVTWVGLEMEFRRVWFGSAN